SAAVGVTLRRDALDNAADRRRLAEDAVVGDPRLAGFRVAVRRRPDAARISDASAIGRPSADAGDGRGPSSGAVLAGSLEPPMEHRTLEMSARGAGSLVPASGSEFGEASSGREREWATQRPTTIAGRTADSDDPSGGDLSPVSGSRPHGSEYVVRPGDTYWTISKRVYGTSRYYRALAEWNRSRVPRADRLRAGVRIATPPLERLESMVAAGEADPRKSAGQATERAPSRPEFGLFVRDGRVFYRVRAGDTLSDIAARHLGSARRWEEVLRLNRHILKKPQDLREGTILRLPPDALPIGVIR
ncbi:MAG: LysM peptidoglycan-binding domain-containing protein, partial [Planctomycetota bacterium]